MHISKINNILVSNKAVKFKNINKMLKTNNQTKIENANFITDTSVVDCRDSKL